jgi:hypothetical protein
MEPVFPESEMVVVPLTQKVDVAAEAVPPTEEGVVVTTTSAVD